MRMERVQVNAYNMNSKNQNHTNLIQRVTNSVRLWKLTVAQLVTKSPTYYGTQRLITVIIRVHWTLS
jgi:hypothetical protein